MTGNQPARMLNHRIFNIDASHETCAMIARQRHINTANAVVTSTSRANRPRQNQRRRFGAAGRASAADASGGKGSMAVSGEVTA